MPDARFTQWQATLQKVGNFAVKILVRTWWGHSSIRPSIHQVTSLYKCYWTCIADFRTYRTEKDNTKTLFPRAHPHPPPSPKKALFGAFTERFFFIFLEIFFFSVTGIWVLGV
jgi:hypothetical protein